MRIFVFAGVLSSFAVRTLPPAQGGWVSSPYAGTGSPVRCSTIFSAMFGGTSS